MTIEKIIGVVHGRFQPFHIGHLDYVMKAKEHCDFLYIGITNPDPSLTKPHKTNLKRASITSNPFKYYERLEMIKTTLINEGIKECNFEIIPFPINFPQYIKCYVPLNGIFFITIYDDWGYSKKEVLESLHLTVRVLQEGSKDLKLAEGTKIRKLMREGMEWEKFVPNSVVKFISNNHLIKKRLLKI